MPISKKSQPDDIETDSRRFYGGMLIMLTAPAFMACYFYGLTALLLLAVSILTAVLCEAAGGFIMRRKKSEIADLNSIYTGAVIAFMLPASIKSLPLVVVGSAFAVIAAKLPFGGTKGAPFIPAAAGFAFLCVCWPADVFSYSDVAAPFGAATALRGESLAAMLHAGNSLNLNIINVFDILSGNFPGPMGTGSILVMLSASTYMFFTRPNALLNSLGYLSGCAAMALIFPRVSSSGLSSVFLELSSGTLVFTALFLLPDPATSPKDKKIYRLLYGILSGVLCMLMRRFGAYEEGACFALLLSNALWPFAQSRLDKLHAFVLKKYGLNISYRPAAINIGGGADGK